MTLAYVQETTSTGTPENMLIHFFSCGRFPAAAAALALLIGCASIDEEGEALGEAEEALETRTFVAAVDTTIDSSRPQAVLSNELTLQADREPSIKRILLRFRVETLPVGVTVTSARLQMFVVDSSGSSGEVHRV